MNEEETTREIAAILVAIRELGTQQRAIIEKLRIVSDDVERIKCYQCTEAITDLHYFT